MIAPYETYLHMLVDLHRLLGPTRYLEIGVNEGHSLACAGSDTRLVGVDPAPLVDSLDHPDWSIVEATSEVDAAFTELRVRVMQRYRIATTLGYGPRFLHSTGQMHKGGANNGLFLQLTADQPEDVPIPGEEYTFATLAAAQALGDLRVLKERGRRVSRVHLGTDPAAEIRALSARVT